MELSVVSTIYKSRTYLESFLNDTVFAISKCGFKTFELIFVLDGITDNSLDYLIERKNNDLPQIKVVELSRNFGHHYAALAGLRCSKGNLVFLIDCDLEVSPLTLVDFKHKMDELKTDVVFGVQKIRKGDFIERELGKIFWKLFNSLSPVKIPENIVTERLMNRGYVNALASLGDRNIFLGGMMYWVGFNQTSLFVSKKKREGKSTYSFYKRINLLIEAITSFSEYPLKLIFNFGCIVFILSLITSICLIVKKIIYPESLLLGFTSIIITLLMVLGLILVAVGIVGIYLARVFRQVQERPQYIIKTITE
jgi:putative glycosyltransferase